MLTRILRVEDKSNYGPYVYHDNLSWMKQSHYDARHPAPQNDGIPSHIMYHDSPWRCGFESRVQFETWFNVPERRALKEMGFELSIYKVNDQNLVKLGHRQLVFCLQGVELMEKICLLSQKSKIPS